MLYNSPFVRVPGHLEQKDVAVTEAELRAKLARAAAEARRQLAGS